MWKVMKTFNTSFKQPMQKHSFHKEPLHLLCISTILTTKAGMCWKKNITPLTDGELYNNF